MVVPCGWGCASEARGDNAASTRPVDTIRALFETPLAHPLRHDPLFAARHGRAAVQRHRIELPAPVHISEVHSATAARSDAGSSSPTCNLMPAPMVNAALGTDLGNPTQNSDGDTVECEFQGTKAGAVTIRIQKGDDATAFAVERKTFQASGQPTKDYAGFGDEAYTNIKKMPLGLPDVNTLVARKGSVDILVSSSASIAAERTLEQQLFAKVG